MYVKNRFTYLYNIQYLLANFCEGPESVREYYKCSIIAVLNGTIQKRLSS